jgi:hypothetical protein
MTHPKEEREMSNETKTLGDEYPKEQARCRQLLADYKEIGRPGMFAAAMIEATLREADEAAVSGDIVAMLRAYQKMQGHE